MLTDAAQPAGSSVPPRLCKPAPDPSGQAPTVNKADRPRADAKVAKAATLIWAG